ncbi:DUF3394 domain-containing protein, partial [Metabacillus halosaccharovorans]
QLLMIDTTWFELVWVIITAFSGMIAIGAGIIGYWFRKLHWAERIIAIITGLLLIYPEGVSDITGIITFVALLALQIFWKRDKENTLKMSN